MSNLLASLTEAKLNQFERFTYAYEYERNLVELWALQNGIHEPSHLTAREPVSVYGSAVRFLRKQPVPTAWSIAFTSTFRKSVAEMDKNIQGRILGALAQLSDSPDSAHGDTIKPLVGDFKGLWRYRVGDYRLVYEPRADSRTVILLDFGARGGIYL